MSGFSGGANWAVPGAIGSTTPSTGAFTTLSATTSFTGPLIKSSAAFQFQTNGTTFAGNIDTSQRWILGTNTAASAGSPVLTVTKNAAQLPQIATETPVVQIAAADGVKTALSLQSFHAGATMQPTVFYGKARGTAASPGAISSGDILGANFAYGWNSATGGYVNTAGAGFVFTATDNYTGAGTSGARIDLYATPAGSSSSQSSVSIAAGLMVNTTSDPGTGNMVATGSIKSTGGTAGVGYATGAGGAVTQATSRTTGVTLNKITGAITLVSAAGSATPATFTVTNSAVAATDVVLVTQQSGTDKYELHVTNTAAGSFALTFFTTGGTTVEQPVFNFAVLKGVAS